MNRVRKGLDAGAKEKNKVKFDESDKSTRNFGKKKIKPKKAKGQKGEMD